LHKKYPIWIDAHQGRNQRVLIAAVKKLPEKSPLNCMLTATELEPELKLWNKIVSAKFKQDLIGCTEKHQIFQFFSQRFLHSLVSVAVLRGAWVGHALPPVFGWPPAWPPSFVLIF